MAIIVDNDTRLVIQGLTEFIVPLDLPGKGATRTVSSPMQIAGLRKIKPTAAPQLGEHGAGILKDLGFDDAEIARLHDAAAVTRFGT